MTEHAVEQDGGSELVSEGSEYLTRPIRVERRQMESFSLEENC